MGVNIFLDEWFHGLLRGLTLCITCLLSFSHGLAQESGLRHIPISWFEGPDMHAPHWRVHFDRPTLTYSQRLVIGVRAILPAIGKEPRPDWHILLRIADKNGRWFQDYDYFRADVRRMPPKATPILWQGYALSSPVPIA